MSSTASINYLRSYGIHHQLACPKILKKNGKAEQKNINITKLGLTMMFHAHLLARFWVDCFSTAVYLINCLPSKALNMESPLLCLHGHHLDYTSLRALGSCYFLFLGDYRAHKLEPKSFPFVFIRYNIKHKGYKCLYASTGRVYISRHVIFDEPILPYSSFAHLYGHDKVTGKLSSLLD